MPPSIPPSAPVVLVHGLCGFDRIFAGRRVIKEYFPGIRTHLESMGHRVLSPRISPTASVAVRAAELKLHLRQEVGSQPVHLIGHSLGGLDARYKTTKLGMEDRVLSLTTIGTPHRGTTFADWGMDRFARFLRPLFRSLGIPDDAFLDLMTDSCRRFNEDVPNVPGVGYYSVAGVCETPLLGAEWWFPHRIVSRAEGPNDGIVSRVSATWGEHTDVWVGDHLNLVNWPNRKAHRCGIQWDRAADYRNLVRRVAMLHV